LKAKQAGNVNKLSTLEKQKRLAAKNKVVIGKEKVSLAKARSAMEKKLASISRNKNKQKHQSPLKKAKAIQKASIKNLKALGHTHVV
jgi:hypothetical protein